jgi:hypothetical protein
MKTLLAFLLCLPGLVNAENWVDTKHKILIDVDSIRKDKDGLVYYSLKHWYDGYDDEPSGWDPARTGAVDCTKRETFRYSKIPGSDWRLRGRKVVPGSMGEQLLDFVCKRLK